MRDAGLIPSQVGLFPCLPDTAVETPALLRDDLAEGMAGLPMELRLQVVTGSGAHLALTRVDVLQVGSARDLSGRQVADLAGCRQFRTVFPEAGPGGGRALIHLRLHLMTGAVAEATLAFDPALSREIHQSHDGCDAPALRGAAPLAAGTFTPITPQMTAPDDEMEVALVVGVTHEGSESGLIHRILYRA